MTIRLYQPVLFVGLGGSGCDVGAQLELQLREEICGPDGTQFIREKKKPDMLPYQLPSCIQFVYADMNQAELDRMPERVVPAAQHPNAVKQTARYVSNLVPPEDNYPDLARNLMLSMKPYVSSWLPPKDDVEPNVNPLHTGAGQFPTVGRAALFETFSHGTTEATRDINTAIGKLAGSGADLHAMEGKSPTAVDVFVAFSVAGGTGGGIFYDFIHLIGNAFEKSGLQAKIFPLVLMPSAFSNEHRESLRAAQLNAARALLDLFRLVDDQNGGTADFNLRSGKDHSGVDPEDPAVTYPVEGKIVLKKGTVQTGFLFSLPLGASREDLHRSVAALVLSLIGTRLEQADQNLGQKYQSFADRFVNSAAQRNALADNGIGNRGVSAALVAAMTVPINEIAGIIADRMLGTAIEQLNAPPRTENNEKEIEAFVTRAGLSEILACRSNDFTEPEPAHGAREIGAALAERREAMQIGLNELRSRLEANVPRLVSHFDPRAGARTLLGGMDLFRAHRVMFGWPTLPQESEKGARGLLDRRAQAPTAPKGISTISPTPPTLSDSKLGLRKLRYHDPVPTRFRELQNRWYRWRSLVQWAEQWSAQAPAWRRTLGDVERELTALAGAMTMYAKEEKDQFDKRGKELYRPRVGVSYMLPPGGTDLGRFYDRVIKSMIESRANTGDVGAGARVADLLNKMISPGGWLEAFEESLRSTPRHAIDALRNTVKTEVESFLRESDKGKQPLLPRLHDLLEAAAGTGTKVSAVDDYLEEFRGKLAGLVPANFAPQGHGPMQILISYPARAQVPVLEEYLKETMTLPAEGQGVSYDLRHTQSESISVVFFRTSMGVTEVGEVREVLRLWADAVPAEKPTDLLRWRQRTGYNFGYLASREAHRVQILHRLLCALWNGQVSAEGDDESPERVRVTLDGDVSMELMLTPYDAASSWGSLLHAYELWALEDDKVRRLFCQKLMQETPNGLDGQPTRPSDLYWKVRKITASQITATEHLLATVPTESKPWVSLLHDFWTKTMDAALDRKFRGVARPVADSLRTLQGKFE